MDCDDKQIEKVLSVNLTSHFWTVKAFLPGMMKQNHGHIAFIASVAGLVGGPRLVDYCASKFGTVGFEEALRYELRAEGYNGIRTSIVCPWFMNTGMFNGVKSDLIAFLDPEYVADEVISGIRANQEMILLPKLMYSLHVLKSIIPTEATFRLAKFLRGDVAMKTFKGREIKAE